MAMSGQGNKCRKVYSEPMAELAIQNAKYVKNCVELYMANKSIEELRGFERFVNLEVLWLNNNELRRINNLDLNFRIKSLYVQNNKLVTLSGSISNFKFLNNLHLYNNKLAYLDKCLSILSRFNYLETLDLFNNPVAQEENYRLRVIHAMPSALKVLDRHAIKPEERAKAQILFGRGNSPADACRLLSSTVQRPASELVGELSGCTLLLHDEVYEILRRREQKDQEAILTKPESVENELGFEQKRGLPQPSFWKGTTDPLYHNGVKLTEWEKHTAKQIFCEHVKGNRSVTYDQVMKALNLIQDRLARNLVNVHSLLVQYIEEDESKEDDVDKDLTGCVFEASEVLKSFVSSDEWVQWTPDICETKSALLFKKSMDKQTKLFSMRESGDSSNNNDEDHGKSSLHRTTFDEALSYATSASRLKALANRHQINTKLKVVEDGTDPSPKSGESQRVRYDIYSVHSFGSKQLEQTNSTGFLIRQPQQEKYGLRGKSLRKFQQHVLVKSRQTQNKLVIQKL